VIGVDVGVMKDTLWRSSQPTTAPAASEAMPCPCQGTPTAQAISAARPSSEKAACSMPTARLSLRRRTVQLRCAVPALSTTRAAASRAN
jgi:hypothetical protein